MSGAEQSGGRRTGQAGPAPPAPSGKGENGSAQERKRSRGRLPTGRHGLSSEEVARSQRRRLLDAMAELSATQGYHATSIAAIVTKAGVSRATYYELFRDKEDCFIATMEEAMRRLFDTIMPVIYQDDKPWVERVSEVLTVGLEFIAAEPNYARAAMVEAHAGGERAAERYRAGMQAIVTLLDQGRALLPDGANLPSSTARAAVGGGEWLVASEMIAGRTERVTELRRDFIYFFLLPYLGQERALAQMDAFEQRLADAPPAAAAEQPAEEPQ